MLDHNQHIIKEIDGTLRRLRIEICGVSEATGEPIAYDRLILIPWARTGAEDKE